MMSKMRRWLELSVDVPADAADVTTGWLVEQCTLGLIEEGGDERVRLRAHFAGERRECDLVGAARAFLEHIDEFFPGAAAALVDVASFEDQDWLARANGDFPPILVGRRLRVRAPWSPPVDSSRLDVAILPAMAFGTGHHATTVGCLEAVEEIFDREGTLSPVLDVGTGSGILAIAAAKLGARDVIALDVDPAAIEAAAKNVRGSGVERLVRLQLGSLERVNGHFPLIVANLYPTLLREMARGFAERAAPGGWLVLSGLLDHECDDMCAATSAAGWMSKAVRSTDGWSTVTLHRSR